MRSPPIRRKSRPPARALSPTPMTSPATTSRSGAAHMSAPPPRSQARHQFPELRKARSRWTARRRDRREPQLPRVVAAARVLERVRVLEQGLVPERALVPEQALGPERVKGLAAL